MIVACVFKTNKALLHPMPAPGPPPGALRCPPRRRAAPRPALPARNRQCQDQAEQAPPAGPLLRGQVRGRGLGPPSPGPGVRAPHTARMDAPGDPEGPRLPRGDRERRGQTPLGGVGPVSFIDD